MENNDEKTKRTEVAGSTDYKGYCSKNVSNSYDNIDQNVKDAARDCGGVLDNSTDQYGGNRYRFISKDNRDKFNQKFDKLKKDKKKKKKISESYINNIVKNILNEYLENNLIK